MERFGGGLEMVWGGLEEVWGRFGEGLGSFGGGLRRGLGQVWGGLGGTSRQWIYNVEFEKTRAWELLNKPQPLNPNP